ncbi:conserved hypothetical protein [Theileria equi strain WA]|uniref:Uncharacterized protein n=1 Tax=Theileria equi strain WA TaxID=1537102 RepID=L1LF31_THEEQ|nr:conserved hypothetical protein [Theileria equi strain WA]EKX73753.1 conserved hypothetical protein [Theileria equi strain WA]|eukprot:XP_004833205.1 conserved hypothetical protein [Theileria equi strain WA]
MGGDGGSIPSRVDLVRTSGYKFTRNIGGMGYLPNTQSRVTNEHLTSNKIKELRWSICALSQEPLSIPIVACKLGLLYNKKSVIEYILSKKPKSSFEHIKGLKDVKDVKFIISKDNGRFICPILRSEFSGSNRGVFIRKCGCCISEKAFKQFLKDSNTEENGCPNCGSIFRYNKALSQDQPQNTILDSDIVLLVPDLNEESLLRANLLSQSKASKS